MLSKYSKLYRSSAFSASMSTCVLLANLTIYGLLSDEIINEYINSSYRKTYKREELELKGIDKRDKNMEEDIRFYYQQTDGPLMHIGGNAHFYFDYFNLYNRLADLNPIRHKLCDFD